VYFFQFTVSANHGYKTSGVKTAMDVLKKIDGEVSFALYLVVPRQIFDDVNFQKYKVGELDDQAVDEEILSIPQFKLLLPYDKEDYEEIPNDRAKQVQVSVPLVLMVNITCANLYMIWIFRLAR